MASSYSATRIPAKSSARIAPASIHFVARLLLCTLSLMSLTCNALRSGGAALGGSSVAAVSYRAHSASSFATVTGRGHSYASRSYTSRRCSSSSSSSDTPSVSAGDALKRVEAMLPNGVFAVYKPTNISSNAAIMRLKRVIYEAVRDATGYTGRIKVKIGHGGTLDPLAEGVLVVGVGKGTKQLSSYLSGAKGYVAEALLGQETDTLDSTGVVTAELPYAHVTREGVAAALALFRGAVKQTPPMYSALHHKGRRLYDLAREGIEVEREQRDVFVYALSLPASEAEAFVGGSAAPYTLPRVGLALECSGGFYVRSLISDLARALGTGAHMTKLVRTKQGAFSAAQSLPESRWTLADIASSVEEGRLLLHEQQEQQ